MSEKKGFVHLPKRWVVERTFGWLNWCRRLSKDYERLPETSETFIYIAMIRIMIHRLYPSDCPLLFYINSENIKCCA
jgi:transposase